MAPATVYPERQRRARSSASTETAAPATAPTLAPRRTETPAGGARRRRPRARPSSRRDRERADQRAVEHGRRGRGEPIHDLRDLVVHRSVGRSSFRSMYRGVRFRRRMALRSRVSDASVSSRSRLASSRVCVAGPPRRGNTRTSNTTPQRARRRARTSRSSTSGHPPRETRWRSPRRRSAPAYFFARSFGQLSNARCCLFRTDGGGPRAVSERSARASAPRARSTQTSRRAPPVLRSLRSRTRVSFEPVVSRAEVPKVVSS